MYPAREKIRGQSWSHPDGTDELSPKKRPRTWSIAGPAPFTPRNGAERKASEDSERETASLSGKTPQLQRYIKADIEQYQFGEEGKGTVFGSTCVLVQSIIGGGLLAYPAGYKMGGFGGMILFQAVLMFFIAGGLRMIAFSAEYTEANTYQLIVRKLLGKRAESVCCGSIVLLIFGACVVYTDIVVDQLQGVTRKIAGCSSSAPTASACSVWYVQRKVLTCTVCVIIFTLCLVRSISKLAGVSVIGFVAMIYVTIVVVLEFEANGPASAQPWGEEAAIFKQDARDWLGILPVICFGFQGHIAAVPLYAEMRNRSLGTFDLVIILALGACLSVYNLTGAVGYLTYGERTQGDILLNMDENKGTVVVARVAVAVAVTVTYAILHFCARSVVLDGIEAAWNGWASGKVKGAPGTPAVKHFPHTPRYTQRVLSPALDGAELAANGATYTATKQTYGAINTAINTAKPAAKGGTNKGNARPTITQPTITPPTARPAINQPIKTLRNPSAKSSKKSDLSTGLLSEDFGDNANSSGSSRQGAITVDVLPRFQVGVQGADGRLVQSINRADGRQTALGKAQKNKGAKGGENKGEVQRGHAPGSGAAKSDTLFLGVTTLWSGAVLAIALAVPNIGSIVSIIGNLSSFFMFQFPGLMYISMALRQPPEEWSLASVRTLRLQDRRTFLVGVGYFFLGNIIFVVGMSCALYNMTHPMQ
jgi:amino acid permease